MLAYLVDNIFTEVGNRVIGIPMGTVCASLIANLFLFYNFMKGLISNLAKSFSTTVRYMDDLLTLDSKTRYLITQYGSTVYIGIAMAYPH